MASGSSASCHNQSEDENLLSDHNLKSSYFSTATSSGSTSWDSGQLTGDGEETIQGNDEETQLASLNIKFKMEDTGIILNRRVTADDLPVITNTINALLGVSLFAMPWGFLHSGLIGGSLIVFLVAALSFETARILLVVQKVLFLKTGEVRSYPEITSELLGPTWSTIVQVATIVSCLGGCTGYLIFVGETIGLLFAIPLTKAVCIVTAPLMLLSLVRSFRELKLFTLIGVAAIISAIFSIIYDGYVAMKATAFVDVPQFQSVHSTMKFVGPATFCFTIHYCVLAMGAESLTDGITKQRLSVSATDRSQLHSSSSSSLSPPLVIAYGFSATLIALLGASGFIMFREADFIRNNAGELESSCIDRICQNVILNLTPGLSRSIVGVCLALSIILSYIIILAPAREHIEVWVMKQVQPNSSNGIMLTMNSVRITLVLLTAIVAIWTPYFGSMLGAVGGLTDALQSFVLPPLIYLKAQRNFGRLTSFQKTFYHLVLIWGLSIIAFTLYNLFDVVLVYLGLLSAGVTNTPSKMTQ